MEDSLITVVQCHCIGVKKRHAAVVESANGEKGAGPEGIEPGTEVSDTLLAYEEDSPISSGHSWLVHRNPSSNSYNSQELKQDEVGRYQP
jgi:hypothetical protein